MNVTGTAGLMLAAATRRRRARRSDLKLCDDWSPTRAMEARRRNLLSSRRRLPQTHREATIAPRNWQERAAFAGRVPVVAVLPTAPVGPGDWKPTPTGKLVLDFTRGKITAKAPGHGGMNLVAVEDVARAHVAALRRGRAGERYVIGGENLSMDDIWDALAQNYGQARCHRGEHPTPLALAVAYADESRCRSIPPPCRSLRSKACACRASGCTPTRPKRSGNSTIARPRPATPSLAPSPGTAGTRWSKNHARPLDEAVVQTAHIRGTQIG